MACEVVSDCRWSTLVDAVDTTSANVDLDVNDKNDIESAKVWLDNIQKDASDLAKLIKERDSEKIKTWLKEKTLELIPTSEQIDEAVGKGKEKIDNIRERLRKK